MTVYVEPKIYKESSLLLIFVYIPISCVLTISANSKESTGLRDKKGSTGQTNKQTNSDDVRTNEYHEK